VNGAGTWSIETGILTFFFNAQVVLGAVVAMETDLPTLASVAVWVVSGQHWDALGAAR
jgi:hypothetical protein